MSLQLLVRSMSAGMTPPLGAVAAGALGAGSATGSATGSGVSSAIGSAMGSATDSDAGLGSGSATGALAALEAAVAPGRPGRAGRLGGRVAARLGRAGSSPPVRRRSSSRATSAGRLPAAGMGLESTCSSSATGGGSAFGRAGPGALDAALVETTTLSRSSREMRSASEDSDTSASSRVSRTNATSSGMRGSRAS